MNLNSDYRYSEWDNSQQVNPFDAHDLMDAISGDLLDDGDLEKVLQRLHRWGDEGKLNDRLQGMKQLMERLRQRRQDLLNRHDLNSMMGDLKEQLQDIVDTERKGSSAGWRRASSRRRPSTSRPAPTTTSRCARCWREWRRRRPTSWMRYPRACHSSSSRSPATTSWTPRRATSSTRCATRSATR